ncbi:PREDICTED: F-box protein At3g49450-like [Nicotiana attenuata]|uniref:F-box protein n=1 Tax=Nicotiana attenuata TaxID=49451 RepID=A0A1J6IBL6_NICAT|nr:PREDICTED: F-box protein At3g49450-like [Nicotiana attenuata]OIT02421.1 f-box protein [Nicotiana attenuata]
MASTSMELSSNIMALPSEVLIDIFSRLSVKHVHQLQTVSNQWLRTISSPHFRRLYNMKSMTRPRALVVEESDQTYSRPSGIGPLSRIITISTIDLAGDNKIQKEFSFKIVGREYSFCVSSNLIIFNHKVCNPTTREIIDLPNYSNYQSVSFDVGYIPYTNTYKIVRLFGTDRGANYNCNYASKILEFGFETLTLTDGGPIPSSWRSMTHREQFSVKVDATCVDGVLYCLVRKGDIKEDRIVSMEIENEEFLTISCPQEDNQKLFENGQLTDLNGKLCLAYYSKELSRMCIFLLKDPKNQTWMKEYDIHLPRMGDWVRIVGYSNGDILIQGKTPLLYNIKEKRGRKLRKSNKNYTRLYYDRCFTLDRSRLRMQRRESSPIRNFHRKVQNVR